MQRVVDLQRVEDFLFLAVEMVGELGGGRRVAEPVGQILHGGTDLEVQFLEPARRLQHPSGVPEVPLDGAGDGGDGERGERGTPLGVEPVDRFHHGEGGHLTDVLEPGTLPAVPVGERARQEQVVLDEPVTQPYPQHGVGAAGQRGEPPRAVGPLAAAGDVLDRVVDRIRGLGPGHGRVYGGAGSGGVAPVGGSD